MNNNIKQEIDNIEIPPQLHLRSQMGIKQAKLEQVEPGRNVKRWTPRKTIVALVVAFILITTAIFNTQVIAAIQKALQYFPGIGMVVEEEIPQERYVLKEPITMEVEGGFVVITGMVVEDKMTVITMSGENTTRLQSIKIINEEGIEYTLESGSTSSTGGQWGGSFWQQGKLDLKGKVQIIIEDNPEVIIPLTLTKAETFNSYQDMGETDTENGVTITAIANRIGGTARISLVSQVPQEIKIINFGIQGIYGDQKIDVIDEKGNRYEIKQFMVSSSIASEHYVSSPISKLNRSKPLLSSPANEFYFELSDSDVPTYNLTIPEINVTYNDKVKISLDIPIDTTADSDKIFQIAGIPVKITKLEVVDKDQLRMYVDLNYSEEATESLVNFKIDAQSYMGKLNEHTRALEYLQFDIKPGSKVMKLTISDPEVVIRGPWKFELPTDKYFRKDK